MNSLLFVGLLAVALFSKTCEASMIPEHPQSAFCNADFVIRVKVLGQIRKDESTPAPVAIHVLGDSSASQNFHKSVDSPPGEDEAKPHTVSSESSLVGSILGRHKRGLAGVRGAPTPPPAGGLDKSSYHRPIGGQRRDKGMMYYDVLIKKIFKGEDKVRNIRGTFIDASNPRRLFAKVYFSSHHGQDLEPGVAYMLSGKIMDNDLVLPSRGCWLEKWEDLSKEELHGLHGNYAANCDCNIRFCVPGFHCKMVQSSLRPTKCAWELRNFKEPSRDCGAKHNWCVKQQGSCHWTTGHGFDLCLNPPRLFPKL